MSEANKDTEQAERAPKHGDMRGELQYSKPQERWVSTAEFAALHGGHSRFLYYED